MKSLAPIRIDEPPTARQYYFYTGVTTSIGLDDPMPYAIDFTHGEKSGKSIGILLHFDGVVKVRR